VKVGDLVRVDYHSDHGRESRLFRGFVSIVLEINNSENHPNGFQLVKVLENGQEQ
jgi:hypothetical protein